MSSSLEARLGPEPPSSHAVHGMLVQLLQLPASPGSVCSALLLLLPTMPAACCLRPRMHLTTGYVEDADKQRQPTNEAWAFSAADKAWTRITYTSAEVPATRLVSQAVVVGNVLWLIGGWDSSVSGPEAFLGDIWSLDLSSWAWSRVDRKSVV